MRVLLLRSHRSSRGSDEPPGNVGKPHTGQRVTDNRMLKLGGTQDAES